MAEIKQSDLLLLVAQFLQQCNLNQSVQMLAKETNLKFNFVPSKLEIKDLILNGSVLELLEKMQNWELSEKCAQQVYKMIFYQLLDDHEVELSNQLLINAQALNSIRDSDPQEYLKLSEMTSVSERVLKEQRELVVNVLLQELEQVGFG